MIAKEKVINENIEDIVKNNNIQHIAIIMDGNRRWAKLNKLPSALGHKKGVEALRNTVRACDKYGIKYLTVYAFSTENWNRKPEEVAFLMDLLANTLKNELKDLDRENVVIRFIGDLTKLNSKLQDILQNAVETTKDNTGVNLQIAFNYGGRDELKNAVINIAQKVKANELNVEDITENTISQALYTSSIPDPDLLIRTGGEMRVSNYLLWQIAYSEFYVTNEFWPEFNAESLATALIEFNNRHRRFGS